jgi:hypothetical protein
MVHGLGGESCAAPAPHAQTTSTGASEPRGRRRFQSQRWWRQALGLHASVAARRDTSCDRCERQDGGPPWPRDVADCAASQWRRRIDRDHCGRLEAPSKSGRPWTCNLPGSLRRLLRIGLFRARKEDRGAGVQGCWARRVCAPLLPCRPGTCPCWRNTPVGLHHCARRPAFIPRSTPTSAHCWLPHCDAPTQRPSPSPPHHNTLLPMYPRQL